MMYWEGLLDCEEVHDKRCCYILTVYVPPEFLCWSLTPNVRVFTNGAFGRCLDHKDGALVNEISALMKETPESSLIPSTMWGHGDDSHLWTMLLSSCRICNVTWSWSSQTLELWEISVCYWSHAAYGILVTAVWIDSDQSCGLDKICHSISRQEWIILHTANLLTLIWPLQALSYHSLLLWPW